MSEESESHCSPGQAVHGGCFCGAVLYSLTLPSKWCAHCHCTMCRRIHGAGYVTWVGMSSENFHLESAEHLKWFASSPGARRGSCNICGSNLLFESGRWPGETHVALASLSGAIDRRPQAHASYNAHVDWMALEDGLAILEGP